jgi:hypothetical protein
VAPKPETQQVTIKINAQGATVSLSVLVTFTDAAFIHTFESTLGARLPGDTNPQRLTVWFPNAKTTLPFTASAESGGWLSVNPASGRGYTELSVMADTSNLGQGNYFGSITLDAPDAVNKTVRIPARIFWTPQPEFWSSPPSLAFSQPLAGPSPPPQSLVINGYHGPAAFTISTDAAWLSVLPSTGTTSTEVKVSVNGAKLLESVYRGNLTVASVGKIPLTVPVKLTITSANYLTLSPSEFTFYSWPNMSGNDQTQRGDISITSSRPLTWTAGKSAAPWLNPPNYNTGSTPFHVLISFDWPILSTYAPGTYTGQIIVSSDEASNSPQFITVHAVILAVAPLKLPGDLIRFTRQGNDPTPQTILIDAASPTRFTAATSSRGNWLSVSPSSAVTPATLTVSVKTAGLDNGSYDGTLTLFVPQPSGPPVPMHIAVNLSVYKTSTPTLTSMSPSTATAGGRGFTLSVQGTDFDGGAAVLRNGQELPTTFVSFTQLRAAVSAHLIASAGLAQVSVANPGGGTSNGLSFNSSPGNGPTITSISPIAAP